MECEKALLSMKLTRADMRAIALLKTFVKVKKDLDVLQEWIKIRLELDEIKKQMGASRV
jgi:hypothetical protein